MKYLLSLAFVLALASAPVQAGPIENMAAQCNIVMNEGLCRVALDPKDYPNATIPIVLPGGVRRVRTAEYLAIRALGFQKDAQGHWLMCQKIYEVCSQWDSDACVTVRSLWKQ